MVVFQKKTTVLGLFLHFIDAFTYCLAFFLKEKLFFDCVFWLCCL